MLMNMKKIFNVRPIKKPKLNFSWAEFPVKDHHEDMMKIFTEFKQQMQEMNKNLLTHPSNRNDRTKDDKAHLDKLYVYYDDLCAWEEKLEMCKFPFDLTTDLKEWLLFNIAVCQGNVATAPNESTENAVNLLQQSAGIFSFLQTSIPTRRLYSLNESHYEETLPKIRLAQAQELLILDAMTKNEPETHIAKLAYWCQELYTCMLRDLFKKEKALHKNYLPYTRSLDYPDWLSQINGKKAEFSGLAQFYQSLKCRNDGKIDEAIARMQFAIENFEMAEANLVESNIFKKIESQARQALADMEKTIGDNIPGLNTLFSKCEVKQLVFMKLITNPMSSNFDGLFETTASCAEDEIVNYMISAELKKLQKDDDKSKKNPINLDFSENFEIYRSDKLPESITKKAKYIHEKGGIQGLRTLIDESKQTLNQIHQMWTDSDHQLNEENMEDIRLRTQYKQKWTLPSSEKTSAVYRSNAALSRDFIKKANAAEKTIQEMFDKNSRGIEFLSCLGNEFSDVHSIKDAKLINKMRFTMEYDHFQKIMDTTKAQRDLIQSKLESAKVDLNKQFEDASEQNQEIKWQIIEKALKPLRQDISDYLDSKQNLNAVYEDLKYSCGEKGNLGIYFEEIPTRYFYGQVRDETKNGVFNELNEAYECFITLNDNLEESKNFYSKLNLMLGILVKDVNGFCSARKRERENLLKTFEEVHFVEEESSLDSFEKDIIIY